MPADPHDIPALIAALGEAAVGSRKLDERVAFAAGYKRSRLGIDGGFDWVTPDRTLSCLPEFSTSLDAALTLVPDAETARVWLTIGAPRAWASIDPIRVHQAATPALAMCCAALTARSIKRSS